MDLSLEKAIKRLKNGDQSAFDDIYQRTYRKIFFVVLPILQDRSLAEDISQDTYIKFLEKLYDYKASNSLAYILTIARNLAINLYHKRKREVSLEQDEPQPFSFESMVEYRLENQELIQTALKALTTIEKNIVMLHLIENMTHREIALVLDKPLGTITWMYAKAVRKMRKTVKKES